jgi:uncharacterized protein
MSEALSRSKPRIDHPQELDRLVRRLVEQVDPVAIYLFGSRARGEGEPDSDYDLMVVVADGAPADGIRTWLRDIHRSHRLPMDVVPIDASGFALWRHEVGTLSFEVANDGIRLYPSGRRPIWIELVPASNDHAAMNRKVVASWLKKVTKDLRMARLASDAADPMPDQAAYHVQQAAEKLTKAALVAHEIRPRKGHVIEYAARRLPDTFSYRSRFFLLNRFSDYAWAHRYPEEDLTRPPPPEPSVAEVKTWIVEVEALKAAFERWLEQAAGGTERG